MGALPDCFVASLLAMTDEELIRGDADKNGIKVFVTISKQQTPWDLSTKSKISALLLYKIFNILYYTYRI